MDCFCRQDIADIFATLPNEKIRYNFNSFLSKLVSLLGGTFSFEVGTYYVDEDERMINVTFNAVVKEDAIIVYGSKDHYAPLLHTLGLPDNISNVLFIEPRVTHVEDIAEQSELGMVILQKLDDALERNVNFRTVFDGYTVNFEVMMSYYSFLNKVLDLASWGMFQQYNIQGMMYESVS